jgi:hypothetical protein
MSLENRSRVSLIAPVLGTLSFIAAFAWMGLMLLAQSLAGMGDGATEPSPAGAAFGYSGSVYLFLVFISCLPFMRGKLLLTTGIIAHLILSVFALSLILEGGVKGVVLLLPFAGFAAGWFSLFKSRKAKHDGKPA